MQNVIMVCLAVAAMSCMVTNTIMVFKLLYKQEPTYKEPEKTAEERERERIAMETYRAEMEGIQNMMAYTGFNWKNKGGAE